jgi:hypothetical protein
MSPLNSTEHGDPHRARTKLGSFAIGLVHGMGGSAGVGILLVASIESQLLGVISLGALAIFTGRSMTISSTGFGAALASRPLRSSLTAVGAWSRSRELRVRDLVRSCRLDPRPLSVLNAARAQLARRSSPCGTRMTSPRIMRFVFVAHPAVKAR